MEQVLRERGIRIPAPFSAAAFCASLAAARGREIHLIPWDTTGAKVECGLWVSTTTADYIIFERATPPILREHIILHELSHLLLGHQGGLSLPPTAGLFDVISPATVQQVLGRRFYAAAEERDAEVLASVIGEHPTRYATEAHQPHAEVVDRFSATLAGDRTWRWATT